MWIYKNTFVFTVTHKTGDAQAYMPEVREWMALHTQPLEGVIS